MASPKLKLFYLSQSLAFTYFWLAIAIPYLLYRGLSPAQAFSLMSIYQLFGVFLEYPTGIIGDRFGYRKVTYLANFLNFLAMITMSLQGGYYLYLFALLILSFGNGFSSGNDMGILKSVSTNIKKDTANYNSLMDFVLFISSILGGLISRISYEIALLTSAIFMLSANIPLYLLGDGIIHTKNTTSVIAIFKDGLKSLMQPTLRQLFIIIALFGGYAYTIKSIFGSFGSQFDISITTIGVIVGLSGLARSLGGKLYAEYPRINIMAIVIATCVAVTLIGVFPAFIPAVILMLSVNLFTAYLGSKIDGDIHDLATDHVRASLFSLKRLSMRLVASGYLMLYGIALGVGKFSLLLFSTGIILLLGVIFARQYLLTSESHKGTTSEVKQD